MSAPLLSPVTVVHDPADTGQVALVKGRRLAEGLDGRLALFSCEFDAALEGSHFRHSERLEAARRRRVDARRASLEALAEPLRAAGLEVSVEAVYEHPRHESIARHALQCPTGAVVMRTHYHPWLDQAVLSAADWQLIRLCPAPLLLVKERPWSAGPRLLAAVDPGHVDDRHARLEKDILDAAEALAAALSGQVRVAHCYLSAAALQAAERGAAFVTGSGPAEDCVGARRAALVKLLDGRGIPADHLCMAEGRPEVELPRMAAEFGTDVLVTGGVSRGRIEQVLIGGTAERMLDRLGCDLLVVKRADFRCPLA